MEKNALSGHTVRLLRRNATEHPDRPAVRVVGQGVSTWFEVEQQARAVAGWLATTVGPGDRVVVALPTSLHFLPAIFGCWYAGAIAVPVPPGRAAERVARHTRAAAILTPETVAQAVAGNLSVEPDTATHPMAVLQHTSGSTGMPKGVLITHHSYLQNLRMIDELARSVAPRMGDLRTVSWLPLFHDMGLSLLMFTVLRGGTATLIPPEDFVADPGLWLRTVDQVGGNMTLGPNFAFDLCVRRVSEADAAGIDLSTLSLVLNGAEPVRVDTLERFSERFGPSGFRAEAMAPCYGLAEGTVLVSGVRYGGPPRTVRFERSALQAGVATEEPATGWPLVSCGRRPEGLAVRIVDPVTRNEQAPGELGEIWVHGPSIGQGYWRDPASGQFFGARTANFDEQDYLRTADRGFVWEGDLFVTGRLADLLTVEGLALHPEDIEHTVERCATELHGRRCVVVPYGEKEDRLALLVEVRLPLPLDESHRERLEDVIRTAVSREHGVEIATIAFLATGTIPVTTSGKAQRTKVRELTPTGIRERAADPR